jgi:hypothetical protein
MVALPPPRRPDEVEKGAQRRRDQTAAGIVEERSGKGALPHFVLADVTVLAIGRRALDERTSSYSGLPDRADRQGSTFGPGDPGLWGSEQGLLPSLQLSEYVPARQLSAAAGRSTVSRPAGSADPAGPALPMWQSRLPAADLCRTFGRSTGLPGPSDGPSRRSPGPGRPCGRWRGRGSAAGSARHAGQPRYPAAPRETHAFASRAGSACGWYR